MAFEISVEAPEITRQRCDNSKLLEFAIESRSNNHFNDVAIKVGDESFPANRLVLACHSRFFRKLFLTEMKERYEHNVEIKNVDDMSMKTLIEFIYTGNITINSKNAMLLLLAADYLQIDEAREFCFEFIESAMSVNNCFNILDVANLYNNASLRKRIFGFVSEHFSEILQGSGFKDLTQKNFSSFVMNFDRNQVDDTLLYETIIEWIKCEEAARKSLLPSLLSHLDLSKISPEYLEQSIATEKLIAESLECSNLVMKSVVKILKDKYVDEPSSKIFSIGGRNTFSQVSLIYNLFDTAPPNYPTLPQPEFDEACVVKKGELVYAIGGRNVKNSMTLSTVWKLNLSTKILEWKEMAPMLSKRSKMGACLYGNLIIVAGGKCHTDGDSTNSAEIYNTLQNQWSTMSSLNTKRLGNALIHLKDAVYAVGGSMGSGQYLSSVEKLNEIDGKWQFVSSMPTARSSLAAVNCNGYIYAIGGVQNQALKTVERYCPQTDQWRSVASMCIERYGHSACVLNGKIFVVGGLQTSSTSLVSIERYDPSKDSWCVVGKTDKGFARHSLFVR